jgi:hypothetical protein
LISSGRELHNPVVAGVDYVNVVVAVHGELRRLVQLREPIPGAT